MVLYLYLETHLSLNLVWSIYGGLTSGTKIPLQEVELKIGGGLTCGGGLMAGFYGISNVMYGLVIVVVHLYEI